MDCYGKSLYGSMAVFVVWFVLVNLSGLPLGLVSSGDAAGAGSAPVCDVVARGAEAPGGHGSVRTSDGPAEGKSSSVGWQGSGRVSLEMLRAAVDSASGGRAGIGGRLSRNGASIAEPRGSAGGVSAGPHVATAVASAETPEARTKVAIEAGLSGGLSASRLKRGTHGVRSLSGGSPGRGRTGRVVAAESSPGGTTTVAAIDEVLVSRRKGRTRLRIELTKPVKSRLEYDREKRLLEIELDDTAAAGAAEAFPPLAIVSCLDVRKREAGRGVTVSMRLNPGVEPSFDKVREPGDELIVTFVEGGRSGNVSSGERLLANESRTLGEGLEYSRHRFISAGGMGTDVHVLRMALKSDEFVLGLALGNKAILGKERLSSMAVRSRAVAGVNASFFARSGEPLGLISVKRKLLSVPVFRRSCFGIFNGTTTLLGNPGFSGKLETDFGEFYLSGINQSGSGAKGRILVYTPEFGASTHTSGPGLEMAISGDRVVALQESDTAIPADGFVVGVRGVPPEGMKGVKFWSKVKYRWGLTPPWDVCEFAVGGGPRLVSGGMESVEWKKEHFSRSFAAERAPRTAVGVCEDGSLVLAVADGRDAPRNTGLSLFELARVMMKLGCRDALNLDGGGSSAMWVNGRIVNKPSDGHERPIGAALLINRRYGALEFARTAAGRSIRGG